MLQRLREREEGFTLIELLVVIIIIGILAAIAIPTFLNQRVKGADASAKSTLSNAAIAQESFFTTENTYATTAAELETEGFNQSTGVVFDVPAADDSSYCMSAIHDNSETTWYLSSDSGAASTVDCS